MDDCRCREATHASNEMCDLIAHDNRTSEPREDSVTRICFNASDAVVNCLLSSHFDDTDTANPANDRSEKYLLMRKNSKQHIKHQQLPTDNVTTVFQQIRIRQTGTIKFSQQCTNTHTHTRQMTCACWERRPLSLILHRWLGAVARQPWFQAIGEGTAFE